MLEHDGHDIDVIFAAEDDGIVSRLDAKGVGEIGIVGVAAVTAAWKFFLSPNANTGASFVSAMVLSLGQ